MSNPTAQSRRTVNGRRYYEIDGELYPSVTSILDVIGKPALVHWAANEERKAVVSASTELYRELMVLPPEKRMSPLVYQASLTTRIGRTKAAEKQSAKALDIGSGAHNRIEWELRKRLDMSHKGPEPIISDESLWAYMAADDWMKSVNLEPVFIEATIYSKRYRYAGTLDLLARIDHQGKRVLALIDFKTSKAIYRESFAQAAAYAEAINEMGHGPVEVGYIVRLPKITIDPKPEAKEVPDMAKQFTAFLHAMSLFAWVNEEAT